MNGRLARAACGMVILAIGIAAAGCRAHPASLAITVIGDVVDDRDVKARQTALLGRPVSAADEMFGKRHDTLIDINNDYRWVIYPEPGEQFAESFYVVEASPDQRVIGLFKCKRNIDGLEDIYKTRELEQKLLGLSPVDCEAAANLSPPVQVFRSEASGVVARIYNARDWTHTRGDRYCLLVFGPNNLCGEVRFIGVTARGGQSIPNSNGPGQTAAAR